MRARRSIAVAVIAGLSAPFPAEAAMNRTPNRLASATSPYLLQHQDNPVDWYPWGQEALARARAEDRPIFLSIGYSACHWCHVMEEESFEDEVTAALMNRHFVCIKVDREERPDLDEIYMTAVQMMTGSGGWPMSVWLTPDLEPFYGGTYFPREPRHGLPSFQQVLGALANAWQSERGSLVAQARRVRESLERYLVDRPPEAREPGESGADPLARATADLSERFDPIHGGFSHAPKFPPHRGLVLLLERWRDTRDENLRRMAKLTLERMAAGGIHDQIGGGFHRYATDAAWQVPHFEKMLYDNALLADAYLEGWLATGDEAWRGVTREIFAWVRREMTDPAGAFYSSMDADSEGEEGRFYVWTPQQVLDVLGPADGALLNDYYGITPAGNFEGATSIPHVELPLEAFTSRSKLSPEDMLKRLVKSRAALREARDRRARPHLDDKILTAWNGLMIRALARASRALDEPSLREAAERAAGFLLSSARGQDGLMRVSFRKGKLSPDAFLDDQAFLIAGLIALHEAGAGPRWLNEAIALTRAAEATFGDPAGGSWFFAPAGRADLLVRTKTLTDGAIPSGNSVMASNLLALARLTGEPGYRARASGILRAARTGMETMPGAHHAMLLALREAGGAPGPSLAGGKIEVAVHPPDSPVLAGGTVRAELVVRIPQGWHVQSPTPSLPDLVPTRVTMAQGAVSLTAAEYPEPRLKPLGFAGRPLAVLEGAVTIRLTMSVAPAEPAGPLMARGEISYQACDDRACLPPARAPFEIPLRISAP